MSEDSINTDKDGLSPSEIAEIASALAPVQPSQERMSAMKSRVLDGVREQEHGAALQPTVQPQVESKTQTDSMESLRTISVASRQWSPYSPGVEVCTLYDDGQRRSALLKMSPGSFLFPHKHQQVEESIVLEGSAIIGADTAIRAGDYQFAEAGSEHPIISSPEGCIVLVHGESKPKIKLTVGLFTRLAGHFFRRTDA